MKRHFPLFVFFSMFLAGIVGQIPQSAIAQDLIRTNNNSGVAPEYQFIIGLLGGLDQSISEASNQSGAVTNIVAFPQLFQGYRQVTPSNYTYIRSNNATVTASAFDTNSSNVKLFNTRLEGTDRTSSLTWFLSSDFNKDRLDIFKDGDTPPELGFAQGVTNIFSSLILPGDRISTATVDNESPIETLFNDSRFNVTPAK